VAVTLRLLVICNEFPYPVIHGGRADVWRRLCAFRQAGVALHMVSWYTERHGRPDQSAIDEVRRVVDGLDFLPISLGPAALLKRLAYLAVLPPHASSRIPTEKHWSTIRQNVAGFRPDAIWLDGLYGAVVAERLCDALAVPLVFRSHNIEHVYMRRQAASATPWHRRIALQLATVGLRRFEEHVHRNSRRVFDISTDDLQYWNGRGMTHSSWLPPTVEVPEVNAAAVSRSDVLFLGNLNTPNNVESIRWLLGSVVPQIRLRRPDTTFRIAGSRPTQEVVALCRATPGVEIVADPPSPWPLYKGARVLVNPARHGSGVQIKTVEMLHVPLPVVSTSVGTQGLSPEVRALVRVADTPEDFASAVLAGLADLEVYSKQRCEALKVFAPEAIAAVVREIEMIAPAR